MALESDFLEMVIRLDSVNALNVAESPMLEQMAADEARAYPRQTPESLVRLQGWLLDQIGRPDFGAFVVVAVTAFGVLFLGGMSGRHFGALGDRLRPVRTAA